MIKSSHAVALKSLTLGIAKTFDKTVEVNNAACLTTT